MGSDDNPGTLRYEEKPVYTTSNGCPIMDPESSQRVGQNGPLLLQDFHLIDLLAHFDRERIPERVVHAKGAGAYGEFEVTHDISDLVGDAEIESAETLTLAVLGRYALQRWQEDEVRGSLFDRGRRERISGFRQRSARLFGEVLYRRGQLGLGVQ